MENLHAFGRFLNQTFFIPAPTFTDKELPDQTGKVHIITGGYAGIGYELTKILYSKNATIYVAGRSASKAEPRIASLKTEFPNSKGRLEFLFLDLADLSTIKASAQEFLAKEKRLDVLTNNAGVMIPPDGSKTKQGYELQTGTHVYGHFLFTILLEGVLKETAKIAETGTVRVTWASSSGAEMMVTPDIIEFNEDGLLKETHPKEICYGQSKAANILQGVELARRWGKDGIISNSFNPGNLASELDRHSSFFQILMMKMIRHPVKLGAWTELYAGWSPDITPALNGCYVIPWGRVGTYKETLQRHGKTKADGGEGVSEKLWEACEKVVKPYM